MKLVKEDRLKRSGHYVGFSDLLSRQKDGAFEVWAGQTILGLTAHLEMLGLL